MSKGAMGARVRREVVVPETAIYSALAAIAAAIEEPYCILGKDELHGLVNAHGRLMRAIGSADQVDYCFRDGAVFSGRGGAWIKCGLLTENPLALDTGEGDSSNDVVISHANRLSSKAGIADESGTA